MRQSPITNKDNSRGLKADSKERWCIGRKINVKLRDQRRPHFERWDSRRINPSVRLKDI